MSHLQTTLADASGTKYKIIQPVRKEPQQQPQRISPKMEHEITDPHITEAYKQFKHRLSLEYRVCERPEDKTVKEMEDLLHMKPGNSSQLGLDMREWLCYGSALCCCFPYILYYIKSTKFVVPANHFALVEDQTKEKAQTMLYGPGFHFLGLYKYLKGIYSLQNKVPDNLIKSNLGDLSIITVDQGTLALFEYNGQYKLMGPGLHVIRDPMQFNETIRLDTFYIKVGPEKWVTIPDQYDGIAIDNGKTVILSGGRQHHLTHENFKFAKLVPKIMLTDRIVTDVPKYIANINRNRELPTIDGTLDPAYYLQTKTKDGSVIYLDTMLFWEVIDTYTAAHKAMTVMELRRSADREVNDQNVHIESASRNIDNLRKTVLRYAKSCLSEAVGRTCLTDDEFLMSKFSSSENKTIDLKNDSSSMLNFAIQNFLNDRASQLVRSLNKDLEEFGVRIAKITINDAIPMPEVQCQLDKQAKAKIDRNTAIVIAETKRQVAEEEMKTDRIQRIGEAENMLEAAKIAKKRAITEAEAVAERERIVAQGKKDAAELQEATDLGHKLALMEAVGQASQAFNSGSGEKVYIVGSPLEAVAKTAGGVIPGLLQSMSK